MSDLADFDRRLAALNAKPREVAWLLSRALGEDRSLERLEQRLAELAKAPPIPVGEARHAGFWPSVPPPPPGAVGAEGAAVADTQAVEGAAPAAVAAVAAVAGPEPEPQPEQEPEPEPESESGPEPESESGPEPEQEPQQEPVAVVAAPQGGQSSAVFAALFDLSEPPPPRISFPADQPAPVAPVLNDDTNVSPPPAEAQPDAPPPVTEDTAQRRVRMDALLDQEIDPSDFPSSPPRPLSRPPQPIVPPAAAMPAEAEEDFELLVDDDEILELDEGELEIVDDE